MAAAVLLPHGHPGQRRASSTVYTLQKFSTISPGQVSSQTSMSIELTGLLSRRPSAADRAGTPCESPIWRQDQQQQLPQREGLQPFAQQQVKLLPLPSTSPLFTPIPPSLPLPPPRPSQLPTLQLLPLPLPQPTRRCTRATSALGPSAHLCSSLSGLDPSWRESSRPSSSRRVTSPDDLAIKISAQQHLLDTRGALASSTLPNRNATAPPSPQATVLQSTALAPPRPESGHVPVPDPGGLGRTSPQPVGAAIRDVASPFWLQGGASGSTDAAAAALGTPARRSVADPVSAEMLVHAAAPRRSPTHTQPPLEPGKKLHTRAQPNLYASSPEIEQATDTGSSSSPAVTAPMDAMIGKADFESCLLPHSALHASRPPLGSPADPLGNTAPHFYRRMVSSVSQASELEGLSPGASLIASVYVHVGMRARLAHHSVLALGWSWRSVGPVDG